MRFRFCGDLDVPDWLLAEIANISKLSARQTHALCEAVVAYILTGAIDYGAVAELTADLEGGHSDTKGAVAAVHFCLVNSAKYDVGDSTLLLEVQQLGLPKENADALSGCFRETKDSLQARLRAAAYRVNGLKDLAWRVDTILACGGSGSSSSAAAELGVAAGTSKAVHLKFTVDPAPQQTAAAGGAAPAAAAVEEVAVSMSAEKFGVLFLELKRAKAQMAAME